MKFSIISILLWIFDDIHKISASYPFFGKCLQHPVVTNFNITKYSGIWYEVEKYFSFADESCTTFMYQAEKGKNENNQTDFLSFLKKSGRNSAIRTRPKSGKVIFSSSKKCGRLGVSYKSSENKEKKLNQTMIIEESYWVLGTDYDNYSIVWSCKNYGIMNFQTVQFLSRHRDPSNLIRGRAYGIIKGHGLSTKLLVSTDQTECPDFFPANNRSRMTTFTKSKPKYAVKE